MERGFFIACTVRGGRADGTAVFPLIGQARWSVVSRLPCRAVSQLLPGPGAFANKTRQLNQQAAANSERVVLLREGVDELVLSG